MLKHFIALGGSGSGKTTLLINMFYDMIRTSNSSKKPESLILLEPHGDASLRAGLIKIIPRDRLVFISNAINRLADNSTGEQYTFTFNPFEHDSEDQRYHLQAELTLAISELLESSAHSTQIGITVQMATLLSNAIAVTLASDEPSFLTLQRLFSSDNEDLLQLGYTYPHPQVQSFFRNQFMSDSYKQTRSSVLTKLSYFLSDTMVYQVLGAKKSTLTLDKFIEEGKVIIIHTPKGVSVNAQSFIGRLIVARVFSAVLRREAIPASQRRSCFMFIDEFQSYITQSLASSLQEARKYSLGILLATQSLRQLSDTKMVNSILTNTYWKAVGVIDADNRTAMAKEMGVHADVIAKLLPLQFLCKRMGNSEAFKFTTQVLADALFYTQDEATALYKDIMCNSGLYTKVQSFASTPPPAPPPTTEKKNSTQEKSTTKKRKDDNPFNGQTPAFTS